LLGIKLVFVANLLLLTTLERFLLYADFKLFLDSDLGIVGF